MKINHIKKGVKMFLSLLLVVGVSSAYSSSCSSYVKIDLKNDSKTDLKVYLKANSAGEPMGYDKNISSDGVLSAKTTGVLKACADTTAHSSHAHGKLAITTTDDKSIGTIDYDFHVKGIGRAYGNNVKEDFCNFTVSKGKGKCTAALYNDYREMKCYCKYTSS